MPGVAVTPKSTAAVAVPDNALVCVPTESTTDNVAESGPGAAGEKLTMMVQDAPAASEVVQLFVPMAKLEALSPPSDTELIGKAALPALLSVKVCAALVAPTVTVAKLAVAAVREACGVAEATPVQLSATVC